MALTLPYQFFLSAYSSNEALLKCSFKCKMKMTALLCENKLTSSWSECLFLCSVWVCVVLKVITQGKIKVKF